MNTEYMELYNEARMSAGWTGLFSVVLVLLSIIFVWMLLQEVKWETFFKFPRSAKAKLFQVVIAVVLGNLFAQFILQYWDYTVMLKGLVE